MINIFWKTVTDQKKSFVFWIIGIVFMVGLLMLFYPAVKESAADLQKFIDSLPPSIKDTFIGGDIDFGSPVGYLTSRLFSTIMPILLFFYAIANGSGSVAGEQEKGTLDTLLANPISRWKIVLAKFFGLLAGILFLVIVSAAVVLIGAPLVDMSLPTQKLIEAFISLYLLALAFGSFALFIGSATGSRGLSIGLAVCVAVATYLINTLAPAVSFLKDIQWTSPFYHYIGENPLEVGLGLDHILFLKGVILTFLLLSLVAFQKRDIKN